RGAPDPSMTVPDRMIRSCAEPDRFGRSCRDTTVDRTRRAGAAFIAEPALRERMLREYRAGFVPGALGSRVELGVDLDRDLLADEHATGFERGVPGDAPVLAIDLATGTEAHDLAPPRGDADAVEGGLERNLLGH